MLAPTHQSGPHMALLTSTLEAEFTPAVGDFVAQSTGIGLVTVMRKNAAAAAWAPAEGGSLFDRAAVISNPVAGAVYKFTLNSGSPVVRADQ